MIKKFTEGELQEYLNKHIKVAHEELQQATYSIKSKVFIDLNEIVFRFDKLNYNVSGKYSNKNGYFEIVVSSCLLQNINLNNNIDISLINILKHEMIHHYVYTKFDKNDSYYGFSNDSSSIFLAYIQFLGTESHHRSYSYYIKYSSISKKVKEYKDFSAFEEYMMDLAMRYKEVFEKLKLDFSCKTVFTNKFIFGNGKVVGVEKPYTYRLDCVNKLEEEYYIIYNKFEIGPIVMPNELEGIYIRKRYEYNLKQTAIKYILDQGIELLKVFDQVNDINIKVASFKGNRRRDDRDLYRVLLNGYFEDIYEFNYISNHRLVRSFVKDNIRSTDYQETYKVTLTTKQIFYIELDLDIKLNVS